MNSSVPINALGNHRHVLVALWAGASFLIVLVWSHFLAEARDTRALELKANERDLASVARLSQEHTSRTLRSADQALRFIQARYREVGDRIDLAGMTKQGVIDTDIVSQVGIINAKGVPTLSNLPLTGQIDVSDHENFAVHLAAKTDDLLISQPLLNSVSGKWSIQLTRRITLPNGGFGGLVMVSMDTGYFTRFFGALNLGTNGMAALYGMDGVARARRAGDQDELGANALNSPLFARIGLGKMSGTYIQRSPEDGVERMFHYLKVPGYELVVATGQDMNELMADSNRAHDALRLQAALASLLIVALTIALTYYLGQLQRHLASQLKAQGQVKDRTDQLNAIFTMSPDGFVSFDKERRVKYVNPSFSEMTALGDARLEGLDEDAFSAWLIGRCSAGTLFTGVASLRAKVTGGKLDVHELIEINQGGIRVLKVGLRCSDTSDASQILYFRDVTVETEVDQMKSEFLSTAAHELRTPMASIFGFTEILLSQENDAASSKEFLDIIYSQSKLMANVLDELLDLARIEARRGKDFRYTRVCLQELVHELTKALKLPPGRNAPVLVMPALPVYVMADVRKLQQAVTNVLSNAFKYSPEGGAVTLKVETRSVIGQPPQVCIHVLDEGIGMTPEQARRTCERFFRADTSGKIPGTGLGMSIVKEIIELHRGDITIVSRIGQGTHISLCLPTNWTPVNDNPEGVQ